MHASSNSAKNTRQVDEARGVSLKYVRTTELWDWLIKLASGFATRLRRQSKHETSPELTALLQRHPGSVAASQFWIIVFNISNLTQRIRGTHLESIDEYTAVALTLGGASASRRYSGCELQTCGGISDGSTLCRACRALRPSKSLGRAAARTMPGAIRQTLLVDENEDLLAAAKTVLRSKLEGVNARIVART